jgi:hypothetical protein
VFELGTCCTTAGCSGRGATFIAVMLSTEGGGCCTETTGGADTSVGEATEGALATTGVEAGST